MYLNVFNVFKNVLYIHRNNVPDTPTLHEYDFVVVVTTLKIILMNIFEAKNNEIHGNGHFTLLQRLYILCWFKFC